MGDESNVLPTSRVARWIAIAGLIAFAVALYFRDGRRLPPVTASSAAPAAPQPTR
jgi:dienelactone hydrolase